MKAKTATLIVIAAMTFGVTAAPAMAQGQRGMVHDNADRQRDGRERLQTLLELYDTDGDGSVTQGEIDSVRADRLASFDADDDGQLTLAEYEALLLDAMRERMVDQFQRHDDDGDGLVTGDEFGEGFVNLVARRDRNDDGVLNADDLRNLRRVSVPETE